MKSLFAKIARVGFTLVLVGAAVAGGVHLYDYYMNEPWTRDGRISADAGPLAMARELADIRARMDRGETKKPGRGTLSACGGVFNKMSINHEGILLPCTMLTSMPMGKMGTDDLKDIWQNHPAINAVRERRTIPTETLDTCHDCSYSGFCTAGCPAMAINESGKLNARDSMSCYRIHLEEEPYDSL